MKDRLLNANLAGTIDDAVYKAKSNELKAEGMRVEERLAENGAEMPVQADDAIALFRLVPKGGRCVARFKQCRSSADSRCDLFEPYSQRRKSRHRKEKAV
jgi:hypothetical protein